MILVDSSVWIDHFRRTDPALVRLLEQRRVLGHPFVTGELALGNMREREAILGALRGLPAAMRASAEEVENLIERKTLFGLGIGYVDVHLLASTMLTAGALFWTRDKRLRALAHRLELDGSPEGEGLVQ